MGKRFYRTGGYKLGNREVDAGGEPDELYNLDVTKLIPDIAIKVVITSGGVDKLEKYKRLSVPEVWFSQKQQIFIYYSHADKYKQVDKSKFLQELNIDLLVRCLNMAAQYNTTLAFSQTL